MDIIRKDNHIKVIGDFKSYYLILTFPYGSENDPINSFGIAHMCEHYILEILKRYIGKDITVYGRTDFDYTICLLRVSDFNDLQKAIQGITAKIYLNIDNEVFDYVKREVLEEFQKKSLIKEKLFRYLFDEYINHLPIGNLTDVGNIFPSTLSSHLDKFYRNNSCIYMGNREIKLEYVGFKIKKESTGFYYQKNKFLNLQQFYGEQSNIYVYFINKNRNDIKFCLFGILMNTIVPQKLKIKFSVYSKRIDRDTSLFYFLFSNMKNTSVQFQVECFIERIKEYRFNQTDIDKAIKIMENIIKPLNEKNIQELSETFIIEVLYDEKSIITYLDVKDVLYEVTQVKEKDLNDLKQRILNRSYHIIQI